MARKVVSQHESYEDEFESDEDVSEHDVIIRAKWMWDGCSTLDQVIIRLYERIGDIKSLQTEGYELISPIVDDYGFLRKRKDVNNSEKKVSKVAGSNENEGLARIATLSLTARESSGGSGEENTSKESSKIEKH